MWHQSQEASFTGNHDDDFGDGFGGDDDVDDNNAYVEDENDKAHQNLSPAGEGGDMEGDVGEDEEGVGVLRKLLQSGYVVRPRESEVDQEAEI